MAAIETTDRISHMMWRLIDPKHPMYDAALAAKYGDAIEKVYRRADDLVGRLQAEGAEGRRLHGDVRPRLPLVPPRGEPQHLAGAERLHGLPRPGGPGEEPAGPLRPRQVLRGRRLERRRRPTRWASGQIYFNLRAARRRGSSPRARSTRRSRTRSATSCCRSRTPTTGERVFQRPSTSATTSTRASTSRYAPDLQVGFNDGYRVGWQDTLGVIRRGGRREQQPEVERRPLRDRHRDQRRRLLLEPQDRERLAAASWTWRPRS